MNATVSHNLDRLNAILPVYQAASGKAYSEVLEKQGKEFTTSLRRALLALKPAKGSIRAAAEARLRAGGGIKIRPSVVASVARKFGTTGSVGRSGRRLNLEAIAAKREIGLRSRSAGYMAFATSVKLSGIAAAKRAERKGKYNQTLETADLRQNIDGQTLTLTYGGYVDGRPLDVGVALQEPRMQAALNSAIDATISNAKAYHAGRHAEEMQKAIDKVGGGL